MNFKKAVLSYITDKGINQNEFAEKAGLNRSQLSKYVSGIAIPGGNVLQRIYDGVPGFEAYLHPPKKTTDIEDIRKELEQIKQQLEEIQLENQKLMKENSEMIADLVKLFKKK